MLVNMLGWSEKYPHICEAIFFSLEPQDFFNCHLVCKSWHNCLNQLANKPIVALLTVNPKLRMSFKCKLMIENVKSDPALHPLGDLPHYILRWGRYFCNEKF